ncbi:MAG: hypothetical protein CME55_01710, partial [Halieaceae bacterium]|nr:hypothetical protein [Halieaceae bacterium]
SIRSDQGREQYAVTPLIASVTIGATEHSRNPSYPGSGQGLEKHRTMASRAHPPYTCALMGDDVWQ